MQKPMATLSLDTFFFSAVLFKKSERGFTYTLVNSLLRFKLVSIGQAFSPISSYIPLYRRQLSLQRNTTFEQQQINDTQQLQSGKLLAAIIYQSVAFEGQVSQSFCLKLLAPWWLCLAEVAMTCKRFPYIQWENPLFSCCRQNKAHLS